MWTSFTSAVTRIELTAVEKGAFQRGQASFKVGSVVDTVGEEPVLEVEILVDVFERPVGDCRPSPLQDLPPSLFDGLLSWSLGFVLVSKHKYHCLSRGTARREDPKIVLWTITEGHLI